jgi:hypothetical protein
MMKNAVLCLCLLGTAGASRRIRKAIEIPKNENWQPSTGLLIEEFEKDFRMLQLSMSMPTGTPPVAPPVTSPIAPPVVAPTEPPIFAPTDAPVVAPTDAPVVAPTDAPVVAPTDAPVVAPTEAPVVAPTDAPVVAPTDAPVVAPTDAPVVAPTDAPVVAPTDAPVVAPTDAPVVAPTDAPAVAPTDAPAVAPTDAPAVAPTEAPVVAPTDAPVVAPTEVPALPPNRISFVPTEAPIETGTPGPVTPSPTPTDDNRNQQILVKCGITALERSRDILSVLTLVSEPVNLITPGAPQFSARDWVDNQDAAIICASNSERIEQRYRAGLLYYALGGDMWTNCRAEKDAGFGDLCLEEEQGDARKRQRRRHLQETEAVRFLDERNECEWFGMTCGDDYDPESGNNDDAYFALQTIDLSANNLEGPLFEELFGFLELEGLFMDGNLKISGSIPEAIGQLTKLRDLDLDDNALTGSLPNALYGITSLRAIDLNDNNLVGELSDAIGSLQNLEVLQLEYNMFSGPLPTDGLLSLLRLGTCNRLGVGSVALNHIH